MSADTHPLLVEAHAGLDLAGSVLAQGATIAPDFTMLTLIAMRDRLNRHQPIIERYREPTCRECGRLWPCPDIEGDFNVLGIDWDADLPDVA